MSVPPPPPPPFDLEPPPPPMDDGLPPPPPPPGVMGNSVPPPPPSDDGLPPPPPPPGEGISTHANGAPPPPPSTVNALPPPPGPARGQTARLPPPPPSNSPIPNSAKHGAPPHLPPPGATPSPRPPPGRTLPPPPGPPGARGLPPPPPGLSPAPRGPVARGPVAPPPGPPNAPQRTPVPPPPAMSPGPPRPPAPPTPPAPPPMSPAPVARPAAAPAGGRGDLLAAIRGGAKLKRAEQGEAAESSRVGGSGGGGDILSAIRQGHQLRSVSSSNPAKSPSPPPKREMSVLDQIQARQKQMKARSASKDSAEIDQAIKRAAIHNNTDDTKGPFNTAMLARAANNAPSSSKPTNDDSDWSDDENNPPAPSKPKPVQHHNSGYAKPTSAPPPHADKTSVHSDVTAQPISTPAAPPASAPAPAPAATHSAPIPQPPQSNGVSHELTTSKPRMNSRRSGVITKQAMDSMLHGSGANATGGAAQTNHTEDNSSKGRITELEGALEEAQLKITKLEKENLELLHQLAENGDEPSPRHTSHDSNELTEVKAALENAKQENESLQTLVQELRTRSSISTGYVSGDATTQTEILSLRKQLSKIKRDKEKALRLIIHLVGKDKLSEYLNHNNSNDRILDQLVETFGSTNTLPTTKRTPKYHTPSKSTAHIAHGRSRIDQYFYMASNH